MSIRMLAEERGNDLSTPDTWLHGADSGADFDADTDTDTDDWDDDESFDDDWSVDAIDA